MKAGIVHTITHTVVENTIVWKVNIYKASDQAEISLAMTPGVMTCTEYMVLNNRDNYCNENKPFATKYGENLNITNVGCIKEIKTSLNEVLSLLEAAGITTVHFQPMDYARYLATNFILRGRKYFPNLRKDGYNPRTYLKSKEFVGFITIIK